LGYDATRSTETHVLQIVSPYLKVQMINLTAQNGFHMKLSYSATRSMNRPRAMDRFIEMVFFLKHVMVWL
jgi:hypothetical protein